MPFGDGPSGKCGIKQAAVHDDPELERKEDQIRELAGQIATIEEKSLRFEEGGAPDNDRIEQTWGIAVLEAGLDRAQKKFTEISDTLDKKMRSESLTRVVGLAQEKCRKRLGEAICTEANERINHLMPHNSIRLKEISGCLKLEERGGASMGETLNVAYAFLSTLLSRNDFHLPFVVDSPVGPLDWPKRVAIAKLIPKLASQFIAFVISTERDGFQDTLEHSCPGKIQYLTLFRKGDAALEEHALTQKNIAQTEDGILVEGKAFFEGFQIAKEVSDAL